MKRVLICTGGGMCGLPAAAALSKLEQLAGVPLACVVDLWGGTSIGGILTLLTASGTPASECINFFTEDGPKIFNKGFMDYGLTGPLYPADKIEQCLQARFMNRTVADLKTKVLIPGLDAVIRESFFAKSYDTSNLIYGAATPLWQIARWTSAAEHYFPGYQYGSRVIWDGGNVANNSAMCAHADVLKLWGEDEPVKFLVLGCGNQITATAYADLISPTAFKLLKIVVDMLFNAQASTVDYQMEQIYGNDYVICQPVFSSPVALDDASDAGLAVLQSAAETFVNTNLANFNWFLS